MIISCWFRILPRWYLPFPFIPFPQENICFLIFSCMPLLLSFCRDTTMPPSQLLFKQHSPTSLLLASTCRYTHPTTKHIFEKNNSNLTPSCTAWSIWSGGLCHLRRGREAIPECLLQWNHWGCWIWRSSQRWVCLPYHTWDCSPPPPRSMGIQPSSASHQGKTPSSMLFPTTCFEHFKLCVFNLILWNFIWQISLCFQKTKKVSKVEVGTRSTDASMDEWLEVCISLFLSLIFRVCFLFVGIEVCVLLCLQGTHLAKSLSGKSKSKKN